MQPVVVVGALLVLTATTAATPSRQAAPSATSTVWSGVYSEAQAKRGQQAYEKACGYCHRDNLEGDEGPPLIGSPFALRWKDQTLAAMFDTIQTTMPQDGPGALSPETYADIISHVLKANGAPAGNAELPTDLKKLEQILFTPKPK